jgi:hypothetical protein
MKTKSYLKNKKKKMAEASSKKTATLGDPNPTAPGDPVGVECEQQATKGQQDTTDTPEGDIKSCASEISDSDFGDLLKSCSRKVSKAKNTDSKTPPFEVLLSKGMLVGRIMEVIENAMHKKEEDDIPLTEEESLHYKRQAQTMDALETHGPFFVYVLCK